MIKLNNKNITYVALADSNNSLKAPKEIWYADSNNSVKLVYRRKDALIEGEDYEKYHWLVGDADAYINTLKYYRPYDDSVQMTFRDNLYPNRESKYNKYNEEEQIWGACEPNNLQSVLIRSYISGLSAPNSFCNNIIDGNTSDSYVNWSTYATQNYINESPEHSLYISSVNNENRYYFIYNGNTKNNLPTRYTLPELVQQDVCIFYSGIHDNGYFNGSFFNFIHYRNNVEITHLTPCKLLKPVPKWLDANGIRRQVGECGMIDLVSGKFYGNVNSVGTFTVENYYERKEWLVGDGSAYIDTDVIVDVPSLRYSLEFIPDTNNTEFLCGSRDSTQHDSYSSAIIIDNVHKDMIRLDAINTASSNLLYGNIMHNVPNEVHIDCQTNSAIVNNSIIPGNRTIFNNSSNTFRIFDVYPKDTSKYPNTCTCKMSYFNLDDGTHSLNLIPCILTMDLPASMDANNIARTKGTSGMWDLVSDKFYGNVASSGTFKAVNLAEGVDYEVHQWLKVSVSTRVDMAALPVDSTNLYFKHKHISGINYHYFRTTGEGVDYDYFYAADTSRCAIWDISDRTAVYNNHDITEDEIVINCNSSNRYVNGYDIPIYGSTIKQVSIISRNQNGFEGLISSITVDGSVRYIPVKLLRSLPSKYDANGIARQAGECGMYDTVNDVFYGNVASSGSFSVSD